MKTIKKRTLWILTLCLILLCGALFSCGGNAGSGDSSDTTVAQVTEPPETKAVTISMEQLPEYVLIRPEEASKELTDACLKLKDLIKKSTGVDLTIKSDFFREGVAALKIYDREILVGDCDRPESREVGKELRRDDYCYRLVGEKLVIRGSDDAGTLKALEAFYTYLLMGEKTDNKDGTLFYSSHDDKTVTGSYEVEKLTLQGHEITEYQIVYPKADREGEQTLAELLADVIARRSGYIVRIVSDSEASGECEILIGDVNRPDCLLCRADVAEGTYICGAEGGRVCARGQKGVGNYYAVYHLMEALFEGEGKERQIMLEKNGRYDIPDMEEGLSAMSFNLLVSEVTDQRQKSVTDTILAYQPDTLGVQEASPLWMTYLKKQLSYLYDSVGEGRDGGNAGEHSAIFYRRDRFELVDQGTKWMSDTPDKVSKFSESSLNRVYTYAVLKLKATGQSVLVVNTHLEHTSDAARVKQVKVLMAGLEALQQKLGRMPVILTGDFNANSSSGVYRTVTEMLTDASNVAREAERSYTFHNYGSSNSLIDFVFITPDSVAVDYYKVVKETQNGMYPSDHFPVYIRYRIFS